MFPQDLPFDAGERLGSTLPYEMRSGLQFLRWRHPPPPPALLVRGARSFCSRLKVGCCVCALHLIEQGAAAAGWHRLRPSPADVMLVDPFISLV